MRKVSRKQTLNFNHQEWLCFSELLKKGYCIHDVLKLMDVSNNQIEQIMVHAQIEEEIISSMKKQTRSYTIFFMRFMSLPQAIESAIQMYDFEMQMKHKLFKQCSYPLFIFSFSLISVYLFSALIIPQLMHSFSVKENTLSVYLVHLIQLMSTCLLLISAFILFAILIIHFNKSIKQHFYQSQLGYLICSPIASYQLSGYLRTLHEKGLSSKESFAYLLELEHFTYLSTAIHSIHEQLLQGNDLCLVIRNHKLLHQRFQNAFVIGTSSGDIEKALSSYSIQQEHLWNHQIRIITISIQICAYVFIGILMVCVYQIMLLPLEMIENL